MTLLTLAGCGVSTGSVSGGPVPEPASEPRLIAYTPNVQVTSADTVQALVGAPADFKDFIASTAADLSAKSQCEDGFVGVTVARVRTDGFAVGGVNDCGGHAALWAVVDGQWREVAATQEAWECAALAEYRVSDSVAGDSCYDTSTQAEQPYRQA